MTMPFPMMIVKYWKLYKYSWVREIFDVSHSPSHSDIICISYRVSHWGKSLPTTYKHEFNLLKGSNAVTMLTFAPKMFLTSRTDVSIVPENVLKGDFSNHTNLPLDSAARRRTVNYRGFWNGIEWVCESDEDRDEIKLIDSAWSFFLPFQSTRPVDAYLELRFLLHNKNECYPRKNLRSDNIETAAGEVESSKKKKVPEPIHINRFGASTRGRHDVCAMNISFICWYLESIWITLKTRSSSKGKFGFDRRKKTSCLESHTLRETKVFPEFEQ